MMKLLWTSKPPSINHAVFSGFPPYWSLQVPSSPSGTLCGINTPLKILTDLYHRIHSHCQGHPQRHPSPRCNPCLQRSTTWYQGKLWLENAQRFLTQKGLSYRWCVFVCVCLCVCVCVCNIRLVVFYATPHYLWRQRAPSSLTLHYARYTPTPISPLLYDNCYPSPCPSPWSRLLLSVPSFSPRFNHARVWSVPSLLHTSAIFAAKCAPLCREVRRGAGC